MKSIAHVCAALCLSRLTAVAQANTCEIETTGDNVTNYSSTDATALQDVVSATSSGDVIKVAGTCTDSNGGNMLSPSVNLSLQGGYLPTDWLVDADLENYPTTLDSDDNGRNLYINSSSLLRNFL